MVWPSGLPVMCVWVWLWAPAAAQTPKSWELLTPSRLGTNSPAREVTELSQTQNSGASTAFRKYLCHFLPHPERKRICNILSSKQTSSGASGSFGNWYLIQHQIQQWFCSGWGRRRNPKQRTSTSPALSHVHFCFPFLLISLSPLIRFAGVLKTDGCFAEGTTSPFKFKDCTCLVHQAQGLEEIVMKTTAGTHNSQFNCKWMVYYLPISNGYGS